MIKDSEIKKIQTQLDEMLSAGEIRKLFSDTRNEALQSLCSSLNLFFEQQQQWQADSVKLKQNYQTMLSNISHDLKTPMTVIAGFAEMIDLSSENTERNQELLEKIQQKIAEVNKMMSAFFSLNKLESGDSEIALSRVNLETLCKESILDFYNTISQNNLEVDIQIPEKPVYILGNKEALKRILNNLISNAIHYGADGGIVGIKLSCDEKNAQIVVWDRGKGIEEKYLAQVFERLYSLEDSRNKHYQGSGLGLTISKRLVELQGGQILLKSKPYQKTSFILQFPLLNY